MPVVYKIDVLAALKEKGYSTARIRKERIFGERVVQQFREGVVPSWAVIGKLCSLLSLEIGDIVAYKE